MNTNATPFISPRPTLAAGSSAAYAAAVGNAQAYGINGKWPLDHLFNGAIRKESFTTV